MSHELLRLAQSLYGKPLLVQPHYAEMVQTVLADRMGVQPLLAAGSTTAKREARRVSMHGGILTVPIVGGLFHRGDSIDAISGAQSYMNLENVMRGAIDNGVEVDGKREAVRGILLDIDSPGGEAAGLFEFADTLMELREIVPIWGIANTTAASAAYAIAASASRLYASPSAYVGSIGVVVMHTDISKAMERKGVAVTFVHAGKMKVAGNSFEPLPQAVRDDIQATVNSSYGRFVEAVARRRTGMTPDAIQKTEARMFDADKAKELGLVDAVASFDEVQVAFTRSLSTPGRFTKMGGVTVKWS